MAKTSARQAILTRRAIFVASALAAVGCPNKTEPSKTETTDTTAETSPAKTTKPRPSAIVARQQPWSDVMKKAPPLDVPGGLSARERPTLVNQATLLKQQYEAVRVVWEATPGCDPSAPACKDWKALEDKARAMFRALDDHGIMGCPGVGGQTGTYTERQRAHRGYLGGLAARIEAHFGNVVLRYGPAGVNAWNAQLTDAKRPPARPCLEPCIMVDVSDLHAVVLFAKNDATLRTSDPAVGKALAHAQRSQQAHHGKATLIVRGHADLDETDPKALGARRAKAVVEYLVKRGIAAADLSERSFGTDLRVVPSTKTTGADPNRFVDFEVVPR